MSSSRTARWKNSGITSCSLSAMTPNTFSMSSLILFSKCPSVDSTMHMNAATWLGSAMVAFSTRCWVGRKHVAKPVGLRANHHLHVEIAIGWQLHDHQQEVVDTIDQSATDLFSNHFVLARDGTGA
ncbi:hypothetical protein PPL_11201 [Heterostelium album PN500]|uniref:Uncharacterized protein n=1 Tax=Heterostelium pallidum (strain ATCC 26659 / Pp 5 / PN500) TaxID=670386 RepID=D3BTU1_HETP5|nr:hypothetical protein PPL_11201 [Heterostelium album PN500]EFA75127.1 hypothetical protein PPL_11201 [Heterostelium album PN500]|eukprot:XP_020427261.1 hypothetical protein PPL_11201 [Heterostelium album PN500]